MDAKYESIKVRLKRSSILGFESQAKTTSILQPLNSRWRTERPCKSFSSENFSWFHSRSPAVFRSDVAITDRNGKTRNFPEK